MSNNVQLARVERGVHAVIPSSHAVARMAAQGGYVLSGDVTATTVGAAQLSAGMVIMPGGGVSRPHIHEHHEIVILFLSGWSVTAAGAQLEDISVHGPGDFKYVASGVPHMGVNLSYTDPVVGVEARADPHFNSDVVVLDHLTDRAADVVQYVREEIQPTIDVSKGHDWIAALADTVR